MPAPTYINVRSAHKADDLALMQWKVSGSKEQNRC
jgi:hypothetical protein